VEGIESTGKGKERGGKKMERRKAGKRSCFCSRHLVIMLAFSLLPRTCRRERKEGWEGKRKGEGKERGKKTVRRFPSATINPLSS